MLTKTDLKGLLKIINNSLTVFTRVEVCGSAAIQLQNIVTDKAADLNILMQMGAFVTEITKPCPAYDKFEYNNATIRRLIQQEPRIDCAAGAVIVLLDDYKERLVQLKMEFSKMEVYLLSKVDYIVSRLGSPDSFKKTAEWKIFDEASCDFICRRFTEIKNVHPDITPGYLKKHIVPDAGKMTLFG